MHQNGSGAGLNAGAEIHFIKDDFAVALVSPALDFIAKQLENTLLKASQ